MLRPTSSTLFPYTTLFRSGGGDKAGGFEPREHGSGAAEDDRGAPAGAEIDQGDRAPDHEGRDAVARAGELGDRKSTRLNSSHLGISYAVFCLKKKKQKKGV